MRVLSTINIAIVTINLNVAPPQIAPAPFPWNPSVYTEPSTPPPFSAGKLGMSEKEVAYCIVGGTKLELNIFYPSVSSTRTFPVVVFIHGGGLNSSPKAPDMSSDGLVGAQAVDARAYTGRGYAFVTIGYRGAQNYKLPTMIEDSKCAIRHLRARAAAYNINADRIGVIGASSGAYLAAMLGLADATAGFEGKGGFDGVSSRVQAVVALYPQVSFELPSFMIPRRTPGLDQDDH